MRKKAFAAMSLLLVCANAMAQTNDAPALVFKPNVHGTIRSKYEHQTESKEGRFEVRNARFSVDGNVAENVAYKAEIDLSNEGKIKMLDAFTRITMMPGLQVQAGQFRVPFTIDAHRAPHMQYFANRSFIAKQMGSVRDVGAMLTYTAGSKYAVTIDAGVFNGSDIADQKPGWKSKLNFSAKAAFSMKQGSDLWNLTLSTQRQCPIAAGGKNAAGEAILMPVTVMMYDAGAYYQNKRLHIEAEYMYKTYSKDAFDCAHAVDVFASYDIPLRKCMFKKVSPLARFDYMTDNSNGKVLASGSDKRLALTDFERLRFTGGVTLSLAKPFISDIRLNYENYFYRRHSVANIAEKDKIVIEFSTRF